MFIIAKYIKIKFKNRRPPCYFLGVKRSKLLQKLTKRDYFCNFLGFIFCGVSRAKTDLHSKYIIIFVFGSFFEQDHLLNLLILGVYAKRWPKCARISKQKLRTIGRSLSEKKCRGTGLVSKETEALYAELNERVEAAISSYSTTGEFLQYFILCLWLIIIRRSDQGVSFMNFTSQIFFLIPFYMAETSYCYYEKVRRTMLTTIVLYLLKYFYSFSAAELNNSESEDEVFAQEFSWKILNNCISGRLNNNYFPLNESSSLY